MTRRLPFTQLSVLRAIQAAQKAGLRVTGIRADGTVTVDDGENAIPAVPAPAVGAQIAGQPARSKWEDRQ
jgi:hypothetical protein